MNIVYNHEMTADNLLALLDWQRNKGGIVAWENQEIGGGAAREVLTPYMRTGEDNVARSVDEDGRPPGWRYGNPRMVDSDTAILATFTPLEGYTARLKKYYWGIGLSEASEKKAQRKVDALKLKHPASTFEYRWTCNGYGIATVEIGEMVRTPFRDSVLAAK